MICWGRRCEDGAAWRRFHVKTSCNELAKIALCEGGEFAAVVMTGKTTSEILFERFCTHAQIACVPIPRDQEQRTPDYDLTFGATRIVAEVKEIARNEEEKESDRQLELRGYGNATGGVPGQRVRQKIHSASPQIKARSQGIHPGMLVLYEQHFAAVNIEPYHILVAMYGLETFILSVPEIEQPYMIGKKFGPNQKMTPNANTSISAR